MVKALPLEVTQASVWYPNQFRDIPRAPHLLYYEGDPACVHMPCIAIIGTREPTDIGYDTALHLAQYYAQKGYCIVSGLAPGIDTAAHRGALTVPGGRTIAILASTLGDDIGKVHKGNSRLAQVILENGGLLMTEYCTPAYAPKRYFERDYLQAAMARIVMPVQAGLRSGTCHTIDHALKLERPVWVPRPYKEDYNAHIEKYAGLREYVILGRAKYFNTTEKDDILS